MYMNILNKGEKITFLDGSASKPDGDASLQAQETPAPPTQVPAAGPCPTPSHRAVQPQEGVRESAQGLEPSQEATAALPY